MKHKTRRWLSLAIVPAAALALFAASAASAADYTDDCAGLPSSVSGNVNISDSNCVLPNSVTATGYIHISATSITGSSHNLTSQGGSIELTASGGNIDVGDLDSTWSNVLLTASGTIQTKDIDTGNGVEFNTSDDVTTKNITSNWGYVTINGKDVETEIINSTNGYIEIEADSFTTDDKDVTSKWSLDIQVENDIDTGTGKLTSNGWYTYVKADNIEVGDVKVEEAGHILLYAEKTLKAGNIEGANPTSGAISYNIDIQANRDGTNSLFEIGNNSTNGVLSIKTHPRGNPQTYANSVVLVKNGTSSSTGGIKLTDGSKISIDGSGSARGSYLFLEANEGSITIQGTSPLTANGDAAGAGVISLQAKTITFPADAIVSASQTDSTGTIHGVVISAETINHDGLTLKSDGNGYDQYSNGYVQTFPKGAVTINNNESPTGSSIYGDIDWEKSGNITYSGSGELKMQANGDYVRVMVQAEKSTFNGGSLTLESKGNQNHTIQFTTSGAYTGSKGVEFKGTGAVTLNANAEEAGDDGGNINFSVDRVTMDAPSISMLANGPSAGNGDGGSIYISSSTFALKSTSYATLNANAASNGTGNAVFNELTGYDPKAITLWPGDVPIKLGSDAGEFSLSATGGGSGGHGGAVTLTGSSVEFMEVNAVKVNALAADGNGGGFLSWAAISIAGGVSDTVVNAEGKGTGIGGKVRFWHFLTDIDFTRYFAVKGGDSLYTATEADFGRLSFNNVHCQARTTGFNDYPKYYWNCAHPDSSTTDEANMRIAISSLPASFDTSLTTGNDVQIFVMDSYQHYNWFFRPVSLLSSDKYGISNLNENFAVVFTSIQTDLRATAIHELAHHLDYRTTPPPRPSDDSDFITAVADVNLNMVGNYPNTPQNPTCMDVYNNQTFCTESSNSGDIHPWAAFVRTAVGSQDIWEETFADGMQVCAGYNDPNPALNNALRSIYMREVYDWLDSSYWPSGCPGQP